MRVRCRDRVRSNQRSKDRNISAKARQAPIFELHTLERRILLSNSPFSYYCSFYNGQPSTNSPTATWGSSQTQQTLTGSQLGPTSPPYYLGNFTGSATLEIDLNLVPGITYQVHFELFVIDYWQNNPWQVIMNGDTQHPLFNSGFVNNPIPPSQSDVPSTDTQSYGGPGQPNGSYPPGTGATNSGIQIDDGRHPWLEDTNCLYTIPSSIYDLQMPLIRPTTRATHLLLGPPPDYPMLTGPAAGFDAHGNYYPDGDGKWGIEWLNVTPVAKLSRVPPCACPTGSLTKTAAGTDGQDPASLAVSPATGVNANDGAVVISALDEQSDATSPWGLFRTYSTQGLSSKTIGNGWMVSQAPYLQTADTYADDATSTVVQRTLVEVSTAIDYRWFDSGPTAGNWTERFFLKDHLTALMQGTTVVGYSLIDTNGGTTTFGPIDPVSGVAKLTSYTDAQGNTTTISANEERQTSPGGGVVSYLNATVNNEPAIILRTSEDGGTTWNYQREIDYVDYQNDPGGNTGDLEYVIERVGNVTPGVGTVMGTTYYRYYTAVDAPSPDEQGNIKFVFSPPSYARMLAAGVNPSNVVPGSDASLQTYADAYYTYDIQNRVISALVQGFGCSCNGATGQGAYDYSYSIATPSTDFTQQEEVTTVTLPSEISNVTEVITTNTGGEVQSDDLVVGSQPNQMQWTQYYSYDSEGRMLSSSSPSGLVTQYNYDTDGWLQTVDEVEGGITTPVESWTYVQGGDNRILISSDTVFGGANGTNPRTTAYFYAFAGQTSQMLCERVQLPPISDAQNGPAIGGDISKADTVIDAFNTVGQVIWSQSANGAFTYNAYDPATGALIKTIVDADYNKLLPAEQQSFDAAAAVVSTSMNITWRRPSGGDNQVTSIVNDGLGRPHEIVDPNGNATVIAYDDPDHRVTTYPGWNAANNTTTGPIEVTREDWADGYDETLSFAGAPSIGADGLPAGNESLAAEPLLSLSRSLTDNSGQVIETDDYFNLSGLTWQAAPVLAGAAASNNSATGNYYATLYEYDDAGNLERTQEPTNTINRTVYDALNRPVSHWVGTSDTTGNGQEWTPTAPGNANLIDVEDDVYDNGGVGDSNLTQVTTHPGNSLPDRVTQYLYDGRDRLVAEKDGVQSSESDGTHRPIYYYQLDAAGEVIGTYQYDGDGISLSDFASAGATDAVPTVDAGKLQAHTAYSYDDQGRVYLAQQFSVDPNTGAVGSALITNYYYDHDGNLAAESDPGGIWMKHAYDGADQDVMDSTTDGGALAGVTPTWQTATSTGGDLVLEQTLNSYDPAGNLIETVDRQRFDTDPSSGIGNLQGPGGAAVASRDYYTATYYDAAERLTDSVDAGTNKGAAWARPQTVPTGSDILLLTHTDYDSAGNVRDTIDPRGIKTGYFYDALGRTIETIGAWDGTSNPTPTASTNQITADTYDGIDDVLTQTAMLPGAAKQQTAWVYGVGGTTGTNLFSNDLISKVEYPIAATGSGLTAGMADNVNSYDQQSFAYDNLGERTAFTDQIGTLHNYMYDVLGRLTADIVTTLGAGADGTVRRLGYSFNGAGLPYQQTSYFNTSGTNLMNQVQDAYNGYGQLTAEYQNHAGAVNTATTPRVLYGYMQLAGQNASLPTGMVYPNGRTIDDLYGGTTTVLSITSSGTTATATTAMPDGLLPGNTVTISGATPSAYDGTFTVTAVLSPTQFTYTMASSPGTSATGTDLSAVAAQPTPLSLTSITGAGTTATATSAQPLNLANGTVFLVTVSGASPALYNGIYNATVSGTYTFTYTLASTPGSSAAGTQMTAALPQLSAAISAISYSGGVATATTTSALNLPVGGTYSVTISGVTPTGYDGTFVVTITGANTFTYTLASDPGGPAGGTHMIAGFASPATLDGTIGRWTGLRDASTSNAAILETYTYLGAATIVQKNRPQDGVDLSYIQQNGDASYNADSGDRYTGLDRFGRVIDQFWANPNTPGTPVDRFQYGYDRDSNVLYRNNLVKSTYSELYHANGASESSAYDSLGRLTSFRRGTLSASGANGSTLDTITTASTTNSWSLDALGNSTSTNGVSRTFNAKDQITAIAGQTTPTYDHDGNMTRDQSGKTYTYDAWDRLVSVTGGSPGNEYYTYDADGRRPGLSVCQGAVTSSYYSAAWQDLEDDVTTSGQCGPSTVKSTYVWSSSYLDDLVERDQGSTRVYAQQDANHDVTSLSSTSGSVLERFAYDPYGTRTVLSASWTSTSDAQSWVYGFQGGRYDPVSGLINFRTRDLNPTLGVWMEPDNLGGYVDGMNLYQFEVDSPIQLDDPLGLATSGGHHYVNDATRRQFSDSISDEAEQLFDQSVSGSTEPPHGFRTYGGISHGKYNKAVEQEFREYVTNKKICPANKMTRAQAQQFLDHIKNSTNPIIRDFNEAVDQAAAKRAALGGLAGSAEAEGAEAAGSKALSGLAGEAAGGVGIVLTSPSSISPTSDLSSGGNVLSDLDSTRWRLANTSMSDAKRARIESFLDDSYKKNTYYEAVECNDIPLLVRLFLPFGGINGQHIEVRENHFWGNMRADMLEANRMIDQKE